MFPQPALNFRQTPCTLLIGAVALALAIAQLLDAERFDQYCRDYRLELWLQIWMGELWRPFTATLLHGNLLHALFNIYWLLIFGAVIETHIGSFRTLGLIVFLGYISSLAEYVLGNYFIADVREHGSAVGLSGVIYGLFGIAWVGSRHRSDYEIVCPTPVVRAMMAWFFLCILLTNLGVLPVANIAHGAGLLLGLVVGKAIFDRRRWPRWTALAAFAGGLVLATLIYCPGHPAFELVRRLGLWWAEGG
jgi:GlpG protein